ANLAELLDKSFKADFLLFRRRQWLYAFELGGFAIADRFVELASRNTATDTGPCFPAAFLLECVAKGICQTHIGKAGKPAFGFKFRQKTRRRRIEGHPAPVGQIDLCPGMRVLHFYFPEAGFLVELAWQESAYDAGRDAIGSAHDHEGAGIFHAISFA